MILIIKIFIKREGEHLDRTLIISDLDGTLLNNESKISKTNEKWIKRFKDQGGLFTFATGRMEKSIYPYIDKLEIDIPVIVYNGAMVYCPITNKALYKKQLYVSQSMWNELLNNDLEVGIFIYKDSKPFVLKRNSIVDEFEKKEKVNCEQGRLEDFIDVPVTKILVIMRERSRHEDVPELKNMEKKLVEGKFECDTVFSESNYLEILPKGSSKGAALKELANYLNVTDLQIIAIGDNLNDIPLLKSADIGVAVQNARSGLKEAADKIVEQSNDEDAIAHVIKRILESNSISNGIFEKL